MGDRAPGQSGRTWTWIIGVAIVAGVMLALLSPSVQRSVLSAVTWCASGGAAGIAVYGLLYCVSTLVVFPAAILTAGAGWAWGLVNGTLIVLAVSLVADWLPFALARRAGRAKVQAAARHAQTLRLLDEAFRHRGFALVALLRLSPIAPYNVTNYLLGLTPVSTLTYLVASTLGCLPGCALVVYAGTLVPHGAALGSVSIFDHPVMLSLSLVLAGVTMLGVMAIARHTLRRMAVVEPG